MGYGIGRLARDTDQAKETDAQLNPPDQNIRDYGGFAPAGTSEADPDDTGKCEICGRMGYWNSGAGQILCARHWDEY